MILNRVTITGADESVDPAALAKLAARYPFVEFGILFSDSRQGKAPRYPGERWVGELLYVAEEADLRLAAHLCGRWVRDLVGEGNPTWWRHHPLRWTTWFRRVQINHHGHYPQAHPDFRSFMDSKSRFSRPHEYILQHGEEADEVVEGYLDLSSVAVLRDGSGGTGVVPDYWRKPLGAYTGYAGGLSPENVAENLRAIERVVGDATIWIDVESGVRHQDGNFSLRRALDFLEEVQPFVGARANGVASSEMG